MKSYNNFDLWGCNTMKLHCIAENVFFPETQEELIDLVKHLKDSEKPFLLLGSGSNIILPPKLNKTVISLTKVSSEMIFFEECVNVDCGVKIQKLIRESQKRGLGGIEYLYSVPCSIGGSILMNAGRGAEYCKSIGNNVLEVTALNIKSGKIVRLKNEQCLFNYRESIFQSGDYVILSVIMHLDKMPQEVIETNIKERLKISYEKLDSSRPSCGSVFVYCSGRIMKFLKGLRIGGAAYSKKTTNWISNINNAKYWQILALIFIAIFIHKVTFQPYRLEVEIWK